MNRQGKNGIGYCDATLNPIVGCVKGCKYCTAARGAPRFRARTVLDIAEGRAIPARKLDDPEDWTFDNPLWYPGRLEDLRRKKPTRWFLCNVSDWLGRDVPFQWACEILSAMNRSPRHKYILLTKQYEWLTYFARHSLHRRSIGDNTVLGVSITNRAQQEPALVALRAVREHIPQATRFVSAEPLRERLDLVEDSFLTSHLIQWIAIGNDSTRRSVPEDAVVWYDNLCYGAKIAGCPVFIKRHGWDTCTPRYRTKDLPAVLQPRQAPT